MKNLIVDGLSGSGKWVIARLCCSLKGVNYVSIPEGLEILVINNFLYPNKNFKSAFETYIRQYNYNKYIGRDVNLRKSDHTYSGIYPFPKLSGVSKRNEKDYSYNTDKNGIAIIETHGGFQCGLAEYLKYFKKSIFVCTVKRDLDDIIHKWVNYVDRYGTDLSERTLTINYKNKTLPWFVFGFEEEYLSSKTSLEKVSVIFYAFHKFNKKASEINNSNILEIDFNDFVLNPMINLKKISAMMGGIEIDDKAYKFLCKELDVPRVSRWKNKGYWKLDGNFNFDKEFSLMRDDYQNKFKVVIKDF